MSHPAKMGRKCCLSPRTKKRLKITIFDLILFVVDIIFDGLAAHLHFSSCNEIWGWVTLACMIFPSLPFFIDYMKTRIQEFKSGKICWSEKFKLQTERTSFGIFFLHILFFLYFAGGFFVVAIGHFLYTVYCIIMMIKDPPGEDDLLVTKYHRGAYQGKFLECQLEAAPQCILQV